MSMSMSKRHTTYSLPHTVLHTTYYILNIQFYILPITYYILPITYYILPTVLHTAYSTQHNYSTYCMLYCVLQTSKQFTINYPCYLRTYEHHAEGPKRTNSKKTMACGSDHRIRTPFRSTSHKPCLLPGIQSSG